jgi:hypothetical protein
MHGTVEKTIDLSTLRSQSYGAEFKTGVFQSRLGFSDASTFSAHSAVKLKGMVIQLENTTGHSKNNNTGAISTVIHTSPIWK